MKMGKKSPITTRRWSLRTLAITGATTLALVVTAITVTATPQARASTTPRASAPFGQKFCMTFLELATTSGWRFAELRREDFLKWPDDSWVDFPPNLINGQDTWTTASGFSRGCDSYVRYAVFVLRCTGGGGGHPCEWRPTGGDVQIGTTFYADGDTTTYCKVSAPGVGSCVKTKQEKRHELFFSEKLTVLWRLTVNA